MGSIGTIGGRSARWTAILAMLVVVAVTVGSASSSARRSAGDTVISFDDLAPGTTVTTQYAAEGITFDQNARGARDPIGNLVIDSVGASGAHSGTQVGSIRTGQVEFPSGDVWGHFTVPREHVFVYVGEDLPGTPTFTLDAFDVAGNPLPGLTSTVKLPAVAATRTFLGVSAPSAEIYSFHVSSNSNASLVDDVSFDGPAPTPTPPDFALSVRGTNGEVALKAGERATTTLGLARNGTSTGRIRFTVSGLPTGVTATVDPNPDSTPGNSPVAVTFTAADDAPADSEEPVTVTAQPGDASAGGSSRSVTVHLTVQGTYKLIATGLEVTQGTQYMQIPTPGPDPTATVPYTGVKLTSWKPTFVRLFLDAQRAPIGGVDVTGELYGYDEDGRPLPGSPLGGSTKAQDIAPHLIQQQRVAGWDSMTFGPLPPAWTQGGVRRFRAVISPPPPPLGGTAPDASVECTTNECKQVLALDVGGIRFYQSYGAVGITVLSLDVRGLPDPPDNPYTYMPFARQLSPVDLVPEGPIARVDITDLWTEAGWSNDERNDKAEDVDSVLQDFENTYPAGSALMGVTNQDASAHDLGMETGGPVFSGDEPVMVVNFNRPLTSVAHELGHAFGRLHASAGCGGGDNGQKAEPWPDGQGHIDGVGLGIVPDSVVPQTLPAGDHYDFMSYCSGDDNGWISPKGWDEIMDWGARYEGGGALSLSRTQGATPGKSMRVIAVNDATGTRITSVAPGTLAAGGNRLPLTAFHLLVKNAAGKVVADTPLHGTVGGHVDGPGGRPFTTLLGQVPATGARTVAVSEGGKIVASESRPDDKLAVRLLAPRTHAHLSRTIRVRWGTAATHAPTLHATIEYSANGGRSWRPVWLGPNAGAVTLPSSLFQFSRKARIRVLVSDGFNQAQAVSGPLTSAGTRPHVAILSPSADKTIAAGQTVTLTGRALDDAYRPIPDGRLVWFAGTTRLGTGGRLAVPAKALGTGRVVITLRARDSRRRLGVARVQITVGG